MALVLRQTIIVLLTIILTFATACGAPSSKLKPVVAIISPPDGAQFAPGEQISLRVAAASSNQIARVELHTGGALVAVQTNSAPSETFSAVLEFTPSQAGEISLTVTAIDASGESSDPVNLTIVIGTPRSILSPDEPTSGDTSANTSGTPNTQAQQNNCKLSATFIEDVTIPDNTLVNPGSALIKTWRLRNTSECNWETGYQLTYIEGEQLGGPDSVTVAPTVRDAAVDISVPFTAPSSSGVYTSTWRMRAPDGTTFGNRVFMVIRVP